MRPRTLRIHFFKKKNNNKKKYISCVVNIVDDKVHEEDSRNLNV